MSPRRRPSAGLSWEQEEFFRYGRMQLLKPPHPVPFASDEEAEMAWRIHGRRIVHEWNDQGKRPQGERLFGPPDLGTR